jgi:S1-C subfamily serine protease
MKKLFVSLLSMLLALPACAMNISRKMEDSTVLIKMKGRNIENNRTGWGNCSGVYIRKDIILSAAHCATPPEGVELKEIWIKKGETSAKAHIIKIDPTVDLLLLQTPLLGTPVKFARRAIRGEDCWVIGNPIRMIDVLTKGIVSKLGFKIGTEKASFIIVDAVVLPGNSGGAVIDRRGHLIGILTRSTSMMGPFGAAGLGLAVDLKTIREFLK